MNTYKPSQATPRGNIPELERYLFRELNRISASMDTLNNPITTLYAEPERPAEGEFQIADGTTWNPGSGFGLYQYLGGSWVFLSGITGGGGVTSVGTGTGLTGGPITTVGTVSLADTAVTAGSYTLSNLTVDPQGRITAITNGTETATTIYNTVADVIADTLLVAGDWVTTKGYTTAGDGGGANYLIAASQAVDGYGDHTLANGTVALLQFEESANVRQFGAKGDGVTGDLAAIQAAIDSLTEGGIVFFPSGVYLVGTDGAVGGTLAGLDMLCIELKDNITLLGEGSASEIKLAQQAGSVGAPYPLAYAVWSGTLSSNQGTIKTTGRRNIAVRRLKIDCDVDNQPSGGTHDIANMRIGECSFIRVQDCELVGGVAETCYLLGKHIDEPQTYFTFTDNHVHDTGEFGVDALGVHMDRINGGVCNNNIFQNIGLRAVGLGKCSDVVVVGNYIERTYDGGVRIAGGDNIVVSSNRMKDCNKYGVEAFPEGTDDCTDINIHNNQIEGNAINGNCGIICVNGSNLNITGNSINQMKWDGVNPSDIIAGIHVRSQVGITTQNLTIANNQVRNIDAGYTSGLVIAPTGIYVEGQVADNTLLSGVSITGNVIDSVYNGYHVQYFNDYAIYGNVLRNITNTGTVFLNFSGTNYGP